MEPKSNAPSFTVSLRGYDRMEVDEYLDSLAEALGKVEQAEERAHGMQAHIDRLNARIAELEEKIRSDVPRTGALLGERIAIMLRSAEETATDTMNRAEAQAAEKLEKAREEVSAAEDQARGAIQRGEEQARRIEAAARAEASEIIAEAEGRATTRTRQIEQWAEQVISHTRAEEARMLKEQQEKRERCEAELRALIEQRDAVAASIAQLREQLGQALGLVGAAAAGAFDQDGREPAGPASATSHLAAFGVTAALQGPEAAAAGPGAASAHRSDVDDRDGDGEGDSHAAGGDAVSAAGEAGTVEAGTVEAGTVEAGTVEAGSGTSATDASATDASASASDASTSASATDASASEEDEQEQEEEMPWPSAFRPVNESDVDDSDQTGEIELRGQEAEEQPAEEPDEFDTKFDAWVSNAGGPRHFRRL